MPNKAQIKLIQTAIRKAGLRIGADDSRYRLLLRQYTDSKGQAIKSCKQLNNAQIDDLLAICEAMGWRYPGKPATYCSDKALKNIHCASFAQQAALRHLAGDLGWNIEQLGGMIERMTGGRTNSLVKLSPRDAYTLIEALKNMLGRRAGKSYKNLTEVQTDTEVAKDGPSKKSKVGQNTFQTNSQLATCR